MYGGPQETDITKALLNIGFSSEDNLSPLQKHITDIEWNKGGIVNKFQGVKLSSEDVAELREINAQVLTPILEAVIKEPEYQALSDSKKKKILDSRVRKARLRVGKQFAYKLKQKDPEFARKWLSAWYRKQGLGDVMPDNLKD